MTLNPQVSAVLAAMAEVPAIDLETITPEQMRANVAPIVCESPPAVAEVRDLVLDLPGRRLSARLYIPEGAGPTPPLTLFFHGGGWVICSIDTHDTLCRALARESGAAILSVDYRLAPESPFPGPVDDCYDALKWALANARSLGTDPARLAVAGDSAGGNLAAAVTIRARDEDGPALRHQLLIYPVTDADFERDSYRASENASGLLSPAMMRWFWQLYVGDLANVSPLAAPLRHANLNGLPPATIIVAQYDPLRDEGLAYAEALRAAGGDVRSEEAMGMIHGFLMMLDAIPDGHPYLARAGARLRADLA